MTGALPKISILTPSYNSVRFIETAIQSVQAQGGLPIEHIIMDGGSRDGTLEILNQFPDLVWRSEPDHGQADALNKALKVARGEIIGWINSDDTYEPGAVQEAVAYLDAHPEVDVVYGDINFIDQMGFPRGKFSGQPFSLQTYILEDYIPQQAAFFRRSALQKVGGWSTNLYMIMDYELFLRLGAVKKLAYVPRTWGNFRLFSGTKTMTEGAIPTRTEKIQILEKFVYRPDLPAAVQASGEKAINYAQALLNVAQAWKYYQVRCSEQAVQQLDVALRTYPMLLDDHARLIAQDLLTWIGRYANQEPAAFAGYVLDHLPHCIQAFHYNIQKTVLAPALAAEMFSARERGDARAGRAAFTRLVKEDPNWLSNRGVLSVGAEVFLGKGTAGMLRQFARRISPGKG